MQVNSNPACKRKALDSLRKGSHDASMSPVKLSPLELLTLPVLDIPLPPKPLLFRTGSRPPKYVVKDFLEIARTIPAERTAEFEQEIKRIWSITKEPVPFTFRTTDNEIVSLDLDCLAALSSRTPPAITLNTDCGYIVSITPASNNVSETDSTVRSDIRRSSLPSRRRRSHRSI